MLAHSFTSKGKKNKAHNAFAFISVFTKLLIHFVFSSLFDWGRLPNSNASVSGEHLKPFSTTVSATVHFLFSKLKTASRMSWPNVLAKDQLGKSAEIQSNLRKFTIQRKVLTQALFLSPQCTKRTTSFTNSRKSKGIAHKKRSELCSWLGPPQNWKEHHCVKFLDKRWPCVALKMKTTTWICFFPWSFDANVSSIHWRRQRHNNTAEVSQKFQLFSCVAEVVCKFPLFANTPWFPATSQKSQKQSNLEFANVCHLVKFLFLMQPTKPVTILPNGKCGRYPHCLARRIKNSFTSS